MVWYLVKHRDNLTFYLLKFYSPVTCICIKMRVCMRLMKCKDKIAPGLN